MIKKLIFILSVITLSSCSYKFNGASIPLEMKTVSVQLLENNALLVIPTLSNDLTEGLKDRIRTQTKLNLIQTEAHGKFEGNITEYEIKPIAFQDNSKPTAGGNRLTISVQIKYTNTLDPKRSFSQPFTAYTDFTLAGKTLDSQQPALIKLVKDQLTENIFNRAFSQW